VDNPFLLVLGVVGGGGFNLCVVGWGWGWGVGWWVGGGCCFFWYWGVVGVGFFGGKCLEVFVVWWCWVVFVVGGFLVFGLGGGGGVGFLSKG